MRVRLVFARVALIGFVASVAASSQARVTSIPEIECTSIASTFVPFFKVRLWPSDPTSGDSYFVEIERREDHRGQVVQRFTAEGAAQFTGRSTLIRMHNSSGWTGELELTTLPNGIRNGELRLDDGHLEELVCGH